MVGLRHVPLSPGRMLYALLFAAVLPALLLVWSARLDALVALPVPRWPGVGIALSACGGGLMLLAMRDLLVFGHGLPMNAYPPERFVTQGAYAWFSHPIYLGAALASLGVSLWSQSGSGLYVITPLLALAASALVLGYERIVLRRMFGAAADQARPLFGLPPASGAPAGWAKKGAMVVRVFAPWFLAGYLIDFARCGDACTYGYVLLCAPQRLQGPGAAAWVLPFVALALALVAARSQASLRSLAIAASLATAASIYLQIVAPAYLGEAHAGAIVQGATSLALVAAGLGYRAVWRALQRVCEWVANSRRDWPFFGGRFRIISHSIWSFLAGALAAGIAGFVAGGSLSGLVLIVFGLIGAALYAQLSWGSSALLRPFGFWGGGAGVAAGILVLWLVQDISLSRLALAAALAAPFAQAAGRLRCLTQGCCHGVPTDARFGIRVWQPQSRVVMLSGLAGRYILMTQLYSILFNLALGFFLVALGRVPGVPVVLVAGAYLALTSIERFAEDGYRGETQTRVILDLKESQWAALGGLAAGILITFLPSSPAVVDAGSADLRLLVAAVLGGLVAAFAMSMDFPKSQARFSRLSG